MVSLFHCFVVKKSCAMTRFIKLFFCLIVFLLFNFYTLKVYAQNYSENGPFYDDNGILTIASDSSYNNKTLFFSSGNTVYIKVESTVIANTNQANSVILYDYYRNSLTSTTFSQTSSVSPYVYQASFVYPSTSRYSNLYINIRDSSANTFLTEQALETSGVSQYYKIFSDSNYTTEKYIFKGSETIYMKIYGNTNYPRRNNQYFYNLGGTSLASFSNSYTINGNWYTLALSLSGQSFVSEKWYRAQVDSSKNPAQINFDVGRLFFVDNTNPTAIISSPAENNTFGNSLSVTGTASDISFDKYKLEMENQTSLGTWIDMGTYTSQVINSTLANLDTSSLSNGIYNLRLTVSDKAGNSNQTNVNNLKRHVYSGIFSVEAPQNENLSSVIVSSSNQSSTGKIGEGTGNSDIKVIDDRGTNEGWSVTMTMTDFFAGSEVMEVSNMTVTPTSVNIIDGSGEGVNAGSQHTFASDSDPATVMIAQNGYGTGTYWNDVNMNFNVPAYSIAGEYSAVVDFSLQ